MRWEVIESWTMRFAALPAASTRWWGGQEADRIGGADEREETLSVNVSYNVPPISMHSSEGQLYTRKICTVPKLLRQFLSFGQHRVLENLFLQNYYYVCESNLGKYSEDDQGHQEGWGYDGADKWLKGGDVHEQAPPPPILRDLKNFILSLT